MSRFLGARHIKRLASLAKEARYSTSGGSSLLKEQYTADQAIMAHMRHIMRRVERLKIQYRAQSVSNKCHLIS